MKKLIFALMLIASCRCFGQYQVGGGMSMAAGDARYLQKTGGEISGRLSVTGNVGIGISNPTRKIQTKGSDLAARFMGSGTEFIDIDINNGGVAQIESGNADLTLGVNADEKVRITDAGNVGIGTDSPGAKVDIIGPKGSQLRLSDTESDATEKAAYVVGRHYNNASDDVTMLFGSMSSGANSVRVGGGSGFANAATELRFYTAANTTTADGTTRMVIDSDGDSAFYGNVTATGYIEDKPCRAYAYLTAPSNTTIASAGTWYPVEGVFSNVVLDGFGTTTVDGKPAIVYTNGYEGRFIVRLLGGVKSGTASDTVGLTLKINNVTNTAAGVPNYVFCKNAGELYSVQNFGVPNITNGTTIQIMTTADHTSTLTFEQMKAKMERWD